MNPSHHFHLALTVVVLAYVATLFGLVVDAGNSHPTTKSTQRSGQAVTENTPAATTGAQSQKLQKRKEALETFDFIHWPVDRKIHFNAKPFQFCTRPCDWGESKGASIKLLSVSKKSADTITLEFHAVVGEKLTTSRSGLFDDSNASDSLLFVYKDSYTYGNLYGKALQLVTEDGKMYQALNGIEGLNVIEFNDSARAAQLPYNQTSIFWVTFPIPQPGAAMMKFVSPSLHGHQAEWWWTLYDVKS